MKLCDIECPKEYLHRVYGRVLLIACHPHDGSCLIIERQETGDPDDDDLTLDMCEASDLSPADGTHWPFLGFTAKKKTAAVNTNSESQK